MVIISFLLLYASHLTHLVCQFLGQNVDLQVPALHCNYISHRALCFWSHENWVHSHWPWGLGPWGWLWAADCFGLEKFNSQYIQIVTIIQIHFRKWITLVGKPVFARIENRLIDFWLLFFFIFLFIYSKKKKKKPYSDWSQDLILLRLLSFLATTDHAGLES